MSTTYLIISYFYPPDVSPRSLRWRALAEYWAAQGNHITVVSAWEPGTAQQEVLNGVEVYRVNAVLLERLHSWFKSTNAAAPTPAGSNRRPILPLVGRLRRRFTRAARWFYHAVYKQLYWPDACFLWYRPAFKRARALASQQHYDVLVSVANPFTSHLVGWGIYRTFPHLCWLADSGDPFSLQERDAPNNLWLYRRLNRRVESQILRYADAFSVTTAATLDRYAAAFPKSASKLHLIPPLLSISYHLVESITPPADDHLRLVFAGRLYADLRRPDFLLQLFKGLLDTPLGERLELHFLGYIRGVYDAFEPYRSLLDQKIFLHGVVSHTEAVQAMQNAHVLVNIGNQTPDQLPSKIVEYASLGKPIVNLIQIEQDSSVDFLRPYPAVLHLCERGSAEVPRQVEQLYHFIANAPKVDPVTLEHWLSSFRLDSIAAAYTRIITCGKSEEKT